jgi:hypothetical protein
LGNRLRWFILGSLIYILIDILLFIAGFNLIAVDPQVLTQTGKNGYILVLVGGASWIGYGGFAIVYLLPRGVHTIWGGTLERDEVLRNLDICPFCLAEKSMAFDWRMKRSEVSCRTCRARWFLHISQGTVMGLQLLNPSSSGKGAGLLGKEYNLEFWRQMRLNEEQAKIAAQRTRASPPKDITKIWGNTPNSSTQNPSINLLSGEIRCGNCGSVNDKKAKHCKNCGASL